MVCYKMVMAQQMEVESTQKWEMFSTVRSKCEYDDGGEGSSLKLIKKTSLRIYFKKKELIISETFKKK